MHFAAKVYLALKVHYELKEQFALQMYYKCILPLPNKHHPLFGEGGAYDIGLFGKDSRLGGNIFCFLEGFLALILIYS